MKEDPSKSVFRNRLQENLAYSEFNLLAETDKEKNVTIIFMIEPADQRIKPKLDLLRFDLYPNVADLLLT